MAYGKKRGAPADIQTNVIKVFDEQSSNFDKGGGSELRVIAWIVNGSEKAPQLERREWWQMEDGTKRAGKAKGLTASDFQFILKNAREIGQYLGLPAKFVEEAMASTPEVNEPVPAETTTNGNEGW